MKKSLLLVPLALSTLMFAQKHNASNSPSLTHMEKEVRHELVMLPNVNVFDNLEFKVDGSTVTLSGQVTRPTLKSEAENVVKGVEGVTQVVNNIKVLPLSPNDDQIRRGVYMSLVSKPQLQIYFMQAVPSIRIVVDNGHVTLAGVVANKGDFDVAKLAATTVPGVFSVDNNLRVEK